MIIEGIVLRSEKGSPLTSAEADGNIVAMKNAIESMSGMTVVGWTQDPIDFALTLEMSDGTFVGPVQLPPRPVIMRGQWITGTEYRDGNIVTNERSTYMAVADHVSADFQLDLDSGRLALLAGVGEPGLPGIAITTNDRGYWGPGETYLQGDSVYHSGIDGIMRVWLALSEIEADVMPGTPGFSGWGVIVVGNGGDTGGGGGSSGPQRDRFLLERLGAVPVGTTLIGKIPVAAAGELVNTSPCATILSVAPGAGRTITVTLRRNGSSIGTVNISGTNIVGYIAVSYPLFATDILSIDVTSSDPGAAVDVTSIIQIQNAA